MRKGYIEVPTSGSICKPEDYGTERESASKHYLLVQNSKTGTYYLWNHAIDDYEKCDQKWALGLHRKMIGKLKGFKVANARRAALRQKV